MHCFFWTILKAIFLIFMLWIWFPLTQTAHHPWTTFPIMHCTHTFPSTITPITQLSPFTHHSDCLTTPAPHSLSHIKAAHKHSPSAKSCFALATFLSVLPRICYLSVCDPGLPDLRSLNLCLWPRPLPGIVYVSALPLIFLLCPLTIACVILPLSNKHILLHLDPLPLTSLYRRLRQLRSSSIISPTQLNHGQHKPTPTSSPGRPDYGRVCSPVLWAVLPGTVVRRVSVQELVLFRTHQSGQGQV